MNGLTKRRTGIWSGIAVVALALLAIVGPGELLAQDASQIRS